MSDERRKQPKVRHFTDLAVWRRAHQLFFAVVVDLECRLFLDVLVDLEHLPNNWPAATAMEQIVHSVGSIEANITAGFNRNRRSYLSSLGVAVGQAAEAENWLYKARDVRFLDRNTAATRIRESIEIQKMLQGLMRSISGDR